MLCGYKMVVRVSVYPYDCVAIWAAQHHKSNVLHIASLEKIRIQSIISTECLSLLHHLKS